MRVCVELFRSTDGVEWEPLPIPAWFRDELLIFREALEQAANGALAAAIETLKRLRSDEMRYWFDEHGQNSGYYRNRNFAMTAPVVSPDTLDPRRSPAKYERAVFERDFPTHFTFPSLIHS
jgi:hypothetical protein